MRSRIELACRENILCTLLLTMLIYKVTNADRLKRVLKINQTAANVKKMIQNLLFQQIDVDEYVKTMFVDDTVTRRNIRNASQPIGKRVYFIFLEYLHPFPGMYQ